MYRLKFLSTKKFESQNGADLNEMRGRSISVWVDSTYSSHIKRKLSKFCNSSLLEVVYGT